MCFKNMTFSSSINHILVALDAIESLTYNEVMLRDGTKLPLSRKKYSDLKEELMKLMVSRTLLTMNAMALAKIHRGIKEHLAALTRPLPQAS